MNKPSTTQADCTFSSAKIINDDNSAFSGGETG